MDTASKVALEQLSRHAALSLEKKKLSKFDKDLIGQTEQIFQSCLIGCGQEWSVPEKYPFGQSNLSSFHDQCWLIACAAQGKRPDQAGSAAGSLNRLRRVARDLAEGKPVENEKRYELKEFLVKFFQNLEIFHTLCAEKNKSAVE